MQQIVVNVKLTKNYVNKNSCYNDVLNLEVSNHLILWFGLGTENGD